MVQAIKHTHALVKFNLILNRDCPGIREEWAQLVQDWEADPAKPCPYVAEATSELLNLYDYQPGSNKL